MVEITTKPFEDDSDKALNEFLARAKQIPIQRLDKEIELACDNHKYCIIFDKNENCHVFFSYKRTMKDIFKEVLAVQIGKKTKEDSIDFLRKGLVYAMRLGDTYCFNLDKLAPDFKTDWTCNTEFPMDKICDFDTWRRDDVYMKIVKPSENYDLMQNKNMYHMKPEFTVCFLSLYKNDREMMKVYENIPNAEKMQVIIVEPQESIENSMQKTKEQIAHENMTKKLSYDYADVYSWQNEGTLSYYEKQFDAFAREKKESQQQFYGKRY